MAGNAYGDILKMIKEAEKAKTPGEEFVADLNRYIQLSKPKHTPSKTIKPSSLGGCFREQWLMLQGAEQDVGKLEKPEDITIQQSGNDRHNRLQNSCQDAHNFNIPIVWCDPVEEAQRAYNMGIRTIIKRRDGNELLCYNEDYHCNFKCDGIIKYKDVKYILEIKTEEYYKFNTRIAPEPKHEFQAALYCLCFGIERVMFLYEDRNLTFRKGYAITVSEEFKNTVKQRIIHLLSYDKAKIVPPKEKDKCTYCHYKQACKKYGDTPAYNVEELEQKIKELESSAIDRAVEEGKSNEQ